ncbi:winged helix-turn-helix transcriptional regulator [Chitinophaga flava]|uniref:Transcriptional regulator n=1 Tax=Chitinophaga flava TaxID=2259036 RepID=A0A365XSF7_9BACT|nr:helix-turn-helix domain-containing protein [Chitinophaga flava]RBL88951.1 transcriptional regulator [Chitinophaga flava]
MENENIFHTTPTYNPAICPVARTLKIIGGKWKPLILHLVGTEMNRFGLLKKCMPDISKHMLTQQLRELEQDGLISRSVYAEMPPRVEYALTPKGDSMLSITAAILEWGKANL